MRTRVLSLLMRPTSPPLVVGVAVAAALVVAETLVLYPLRQVAPAVSLGMVYLLGVLVVSSVWGFTLGVVTAVLSTVVYDFFHVPPTLSLVSRSAAGQAALVILLVVALLLSLIAALARSRAIEADVRRREADLAAEMARLLLRTDDLRSALPKASARLARAIAVSSAAIELEPLTGDERRAAFPLRDGGTPLGTLLVPADLPQGTELRVRERVVPSLESLLRAAREREAIGSALEASRDELHALAEEQAALRRLATLVARGAPSEEVFRAVTEEVGRVLPVDFALMGRYETDDTVTSIAAWGTSVASFPVGGRWDLGGKNLVTIVGETGRPARIDDYADTSSGSIGTTGRKSGFNSTVGGPILVEGRLWGVMAVGSTRDEPPLPMGTEERLAHFTELLATAVANAESRAALARLAEEQAALRRVATLVAAGAPPEDVFAAVADEVERLLPVDFAHMGRYEADGAVTVLAASGSTVANFAVGRRWILGGKNLATIVFETGRSARLDGYPDASGPLGAAARELGLSSSAGSPIIVDDHVWGVVIAGTTVERPLPADTEARLASFTELVATAIANAESRAALAASRARIVAAADESRRRIERDLHDGAQQRLVHAVIVLKLALRALSNGDANASELVAEALRHAEQANSELRELAHGILPAALSRGGLRAGVEALVSRVSLPVSVDVSVERLPATVEATAYFVVSEALTNVVKHARAAGARVTARVANGELQVEVRDDGVGGARGGDSSGLGGLEDRVAALDGRLVLESPPGGGTRVCALVPVSGQG